MWIIFIYIYIYIYIYTYLCCFIKYFVVITKIIIKSLYNTTDNYLHNVNVSTVIDVPRSPPALIYL